MCVLRFPRRLGFKVVIDRLSDALVFPEYPLEISMLALRRKGSSEHLGSNRNLNIRFQG